MKILIIGLGIGEVYREQAENLGYSVITVDPDTKKEADYTDINNVYVDHPFFDISIIATPNYTHESYILITGKRSNLVLVEKPGLSSPDHWMKITKAIWPTPLVMVKNNLYRNLSNLEPFYDKADTINILWTDQNRVPQPGGWFTNKLKAWGGISYDLMPHLLSYYLGLGFDTINPIESARYQRYNIEDISSTEYGIIHDNPTYNVDDHCLLRYKTNGKNINLVAAWKDEDLSRDYREIQFIYKNKLLHSFEFGLCPNEVYGKMIKSFENMNETQIKLHNELDTWIISQIYTVSNQEFSLNQYIDLGN